MSKTLTYDKKTAKEVSALIKTIGDTIKGEDEDVTMKACLAIAILMQEPKINLVKLIQGVEGASEWIALWLMETPNGSVN